MSTSGSQVYESGNFWYAEGAVGTADWSATPRTKLNECAAGSKPSAAAATDSWYLASSFTVGDGDGEGNITFTAEGTAECIGLTPSFKNIIKGRETASP